MNSLSTTKKQRTSKRRRLLLVVALLFVLVISTGAGAWYYTNQLDSQKNTADGSANGDSTDQDDTDGLPDADVDDPTSNSVKTNDPSPASSGDTKVEITAAYVNGDTFDIRTLIDRVTASGQCTLSMKSDSGKSYSASVGVQALPSSSTCKGFSVPMSSLSSGVWNITVSYVNDGKTSTASKEVVINE